MTLSDRHDDATRFAHARERVLLDELRTLSRRVQRLEDELRRARAESAQRSSVLRKDVERLRSEHRKTTKRLEQRIEDRRLDRQILSVPRRIKRKLTGGGPPRRVAVICPSYPGGPTRYGGEFVRARVRGYVDQGLAVTVIVVPRARRTVAMAYEHEGVPVRRTDPSGLGKLLDGLGVDAVAVHHLEEPVWRVLEPRLDDFAQVAVFVHGYEARDWRELAFNLTHEQVASQSDGLEELNAVRRVTMSAAFADPRVHAVFVSRFMREVAEDFAGQRAEPASVIPNVIDRRAFPYTPRSPEQRRRILWVRSFSAHNYANDVSRDTVVELSKRAVAEDLRFTIAGDGVHFEEITAPLVDLPNVTIRRGFVDTEGMRELHADHGIMLVPSRWDSQGLTCGEAMSSGLVPVTTRVAAVPEFVPEDAGWLCPPEDHVAMADAIEAMQDDPTLFLRMSARAAEAIQERCGYEATVGREVALLSARTGVLGRRRSG